MQICWLESFLELKFPLYLNARESTDSCKNPIMAATNFFPYKIPVNSTVYLLPPMIAILCLIHRTTVTSLSSPKDTRCKTHPLYFHFVSMYKKRDTPLLLSILNTILRNFSLSIPTQFLSLVLAADKAWLCNVFTLYLRQLCSRYDAKNVRAPSFGRVWTKSCGSSRSQVCSNTSRINDKKGKKKLIKLSSKLSIRFQRYRHFSDAQNNKIQRKLNAIIDPI